MQLKVCRLKYTLLSLSLEILDGNANMMKFLIATSLMDMFSKLGFTKKTPMLIYFALKA